MARKIAVQSRTALLCTVAMNTSMDIVNLRKFDEVLEGKAVSPSRGASAEERRPTKV